MKQSSVKANNLRSNDQASPNCSSDSYHANVTSLESSMQRMPLVDGILARSMNAIVADSFFGSALIWRLLTIVGDDMLVDMRSHFVRAITRQAVGKQRRSVCDRRR